MLKTDFIERLRHQLAELGCPVARARQLVQEVADHREDLKQTALLEGLSEADAELRADAQLGDPFDLGEHLMAALRRSSWWGRHSLIGFCLLPLLAVPLLWALFLFLGLSLEFALGYGWDSQKLNLVADNPAAFHHLVLVVQCADLVAIALVALLFCWLARRSAVSLLWLVTACGICALCALFIHVDIKPHVFSLGYFWSPGMSWTTQWIRSVTPLFIAGAIYAFQRRTKPGFHEQVAV